MWTDHVIAAINETAAKDDPARPLFAYLALAAAHAPLQAPDAALAPFPKTMYHDRRSYNGLMSALDTNIGRVVSALKAHTGMWEKTLLLFTSDNGYVRVRFLFEVPVVSVCLVWLGVDCIVL
jgi:arylsulfatase A-like enzyme